MAPPEYLIQWPVIPSLGRLRQEAPSSRLEIETLAQKTQANCQTDLDAKRRPSQSASQREALRGSKLSQPVTGGTLFLRTHVTHLALQIAAIHATPLPAVSRTVLTQALSQAGNPFSLSSGCCGCTSKIHLFTLSHPASRLLAPFPSC